MLLLVIVLGVSLLLCVPVGTYIARVMQGERMWLKPVENVVYWLCAVNPVKESGWAHYTVNLILFSLLGTLLLYALLLTQAWLPLNPGNLPNISPDLAFNIAVSFVTNTNWQSYAGETTLSPFVQMAGLTVQNFLSPAVGIAVAFALFRAFVRKQSPTIGNFWADVTRAVLYILLPFSLILAALLASQGVVQDFSAPVQAVTLEGAKQTITTGPVASQIAIKMLGSNGGGYFGVNSAHPFENPTPFSNLLQLVSILLLPLSMIYAFGVTVGDRKQGIALLSAVMLMFLPLLALSVWQEWQPNPALGGLAAPGNMEGKELRFSTESAALWGAATTATSNGSVNAMHGSFMPLSTLSQLLLMQMGEVVIGGVGCGAYGLLVFVVITVFIAGLMVGRTPEYMGKKLGPFEIKMASLAILLPSALTLLGAALCVSLEAGRAGSLNPGAMGFSEILYAATSAAANNGSALAGLSANTPFYNTLLALLMAGGRFFIIIPVLALAGAVAMRGTVPQGAGTLPTHTPLFVCMLIAVVLILGVLTYVPSLALGPIVSHLQLGG